MGVRDVFGISAGTLVGIWFVNPAATYQYVGHIPGLVLQTYELIPIIQRLSAKHFWLRLATSTLPRSAPCSHLSLANISQIKSS